MLVEKNLKLHLHLNQWPKLNNYTHISCLMPSPGIVQIVLMKKKWWPGLKNRIVLKHLRMSQDSGTQARALLFENVSFEKG